MRQQIVDQQSFTLKNIGQEPFFSEYQVTNPKTKGQYRLAIRGTGLGDNFCSCPDFAINTLGTCKHIEYTLKALARKRGGKKALAAGFTPTYSEIYLRYGAQREIVFRPGTDCPAKVLIVCPTSLKHQWAQEITTFTQRSVCVVEGMIPKRRDLYRQGNGFFKITNYDVIHRDLEAIMAWSPELIILDEAQRIKNWQTRTAQSVKKLTCPYTHAQTGGGYRGRARRAANTRNSKAGSHIHISSSPGLARPNERGPVPGGETLCLSIIPNQALHAKDAVP